MLGTKTLQPKLYYSLSLEDLVPKDDFYRKLEQAVDLSWVRSLVAHYYSHIGRPSIDPEVFVKIELIGYIEGIFSERELMRQIHDRLSLRRYIGYDLDEQVPDHSTLSKTRDLLGIGLCQEILDRSVRLCEAAGMVSGLHLSVDRTLVKANASLGSMEPRIVQQMPQEFVERVFAENPIQSGEAEEPNPIISLSELPNYPTQLPVAREALPDQGSSSAEAIPEGRRQPESSGQLGEQEPMSGAQPELEGNTERSEGEAVSEREPRLGVSGEIAKSDLPQDRREKKSKVGLSNATHVSRTDPDATIVARAGKHPMLAYSAEFWVDSRAGVITHADGFTGTVPEHDTVMAGIRRQREELGLAIASVSMDKGYGQGWLYRQLKEGGVMAFIPHQEYVNCGISPGQYRREDFRYDGERGVYVCPAGKELSYAYLRVRWPWAYHIWRAKASDCKNCQMRSKCTKAVEGRELGINMYQSYYDEMDERLSGRGARLAAIARKTGPEPRFAEGKQWQGLWRAKYRGVEKFRGQVMMTAAAQNLKKYVKWIWRKGEGAGRATLETVRKVSPALRLERALSVCGLFSL